jgi:hypothetical protein
MEPRVVERGGLNNARVSHSGRGARGEGGGGMYLSQSDVEGRRSRRPCLYQQRA